MASEIQSPRRVAGGPQWKGQLRDEDGQFASAGGGAGRLMELAKRASKDVDLDEILDAAGHPADRLQTSKASNLTSLRSTLRFGGYYEAAKQAEWESDALRAFWYDKDSGVIRLTDPSRDGKASIEEIDKAVDADAAWLSRLSAILRDLHDAHLKQQGGRHWRAPHADHIIALLTRAVGVVDANGVSP